MKKLTGNRYCCQATVDALFHILNRDQVPPPGRGNATNLVLGCRWTGAVPSYHRMSWPWYSTNTKWPPCPQDYCRLLLNCAPIVWHTCHTDWCARLAGWHGLTATPSGQITQQELSYRTDRRRYITDLRLFLKAKRMINGATEFALASKSAKRLKARRAKGQLS